MKRTASSLPKFKSTHTIQILLLLSVAFLTTTVCAQSPVPLKFNPTITCTYGCPAKDAANVPMSASLYMSSSNSWRCWYRPAGQTPTMDLTMALGTFSSVCGYDYSTGKILADVNKGRCAQSATAVSCTFSRREAAEGRVVQAARPGAVPQAPWPPTRAAFAPKPRVMHVRAELGLGRKGKTRSRVGH
ncbi:hypothetical protein D9611_003119 [Ephemerocybe angulata]|uniref:Uncharacterized protein n=1 Tax=Ephemerocybe angulata TaxID=980116 RepID=A0A8H5C9A3_9AGAR|nr:hypothetical protein D9611_003119 [Tulosesus angulatus]